MPLPSSEKFIIFGHNPDLVFKKLIVRRDEANKINAAAKLGLIIDGGGMRSIIASGLLVAFHEFGLNNIFDYVYGISAGAVSGAYFLSGQAPYGISIYYEDINNSEFISFKRGIPFFDIDYLINVVKHKKCLDIKAIKQSKTEFFVSATDIETGQIRFFNGKEDVDLFLTLKASCALPIYYDKPVKIEGSHYLDGGMSGIVPILCKAIADGCTDILILLNKPKNHYSYIKSPLLWVGAWKLKWLLTRFKKVAFTQHNNFDKLFTIIEGKDRLSADVNIAAIAPVEKPFHSATRDGCKLKSAYGVSYDYGRDLLKCLSYDHTPLYF